MSLMEEQNRLWPYTSSDNNLSHNSLASYYGQPIQMTWDQESENIDKNELSMYVCNVCMKTFYNKNALLNHKNMTHDISNTDENFDLNTHAKLVQDLKTCYGFKFIPLNSKEYSGSEIITRTFTEDTSYLIVRADYDYSEVFEKARKVRLDNSAKKNVRTVEKAPVNIRGPFTCTLPSTMCPDLQCQQIFFNCCEYSLHYREEHTKRRKAALRCQVCEKRLDSDADSIVTAAVPAATSQPILFPCRICGIQFSGETKFEEHNRLMHTKMKPHKCSICFKRFAQLGGLQQHLRMHTGIRPFICTFCPKAFTQKAGLDQHLRIHTKVKPFKCVICSKCFSQSVHLRQHMRTHTNIQPFECSVCTKRFKQRSHLNFHLKSHMNEAVVDATDLRRYEEALRHQNGIELYNLENVKQTQNGEAFMYAAELASKQRNNLNVSNSRIFNMTQTQTAHEVLKEGEKENLGDHLSSTYVNQSMSLPVIVDNDLPNPYGKQPRAFSDNEKNKLPNRYAADDLRHVQVSQPRSLPVIEDDDTQINQQRSLPVIADDNNFDNLPNMHVSPPRSLPVIEDDDNLSNQINQQRSLPVIADDNNFDNLPNMHVSPPRSLPVIEDDDNLNIQINQQRSLPVIADDNNIDNLPNMHVSPPRSLPVIGDDDNLQNMYANHNQSRSLPVIEEC